jgi:hypothetical protein
VAIYTVHLLEESKLTISGGGQLDGVTQGDGSHMLGRTVTINSGPTQAIQVTDGSASNSDNNFADNDGNQSLTNTISIDEDGDGIQETYGAGTRIEAEFQFVMRDPGTGATYRVLAVNIRNSSPAYGTVEGIAFVNEVPPQNVALQVISAQEGPSNSGGGAVAGANTVPFCVTHGTLIETDQGPRPVQDLQAGDLVQTLDNGFAPVLALFSCELGPEALSENPKLHPGRIRAGRLGRGLPKRELWVSRQHRMLVSSKVAGRMFGLKDVLIPAIKLTQMPGIRVDSRAQSVTYFHILMADHQVIYAEGAPTETLHTGPGVLETMPPETVAELHRHFPDLMAQFDPQTAKPVPPLPKQKRLVSRLRKNRQPLLDEA